MLTISTIAKKKVPRNFPIIYRSIFLKLRELHLTHQSHGFIKTQTKIQLIPRKRHLRQGIRQKNHSRKFLTVAEPVF